MSVKTNVSYQQINRQSERSLTELLNLGRRYVAGVDALYPSYRADCKRNANLYTTEAMEAQRKQVQADYKRRLLNAFDELWRDAEIELDLMRDALAAWVSEPGNPAFLAQIGAYRDFGLDLSKTELEALVEGAGGNYVCLRCLDKLAGQSGYKVAVPSVDALGKDLESIRQDFWGLRLYAPLGEGDALDLLPDMVTIGGMQMGRPTINSVTIAYQTARNIEGHLAAVKGRWATNVLPVVTATAEVYGVDQQDVQEEAERVRAESNEHRTTSDTVTVDGAGDDGVKLARQMGQKMAQTNAQAAKGMEHYLGG